MKPSKHFILTPCIVIAALCSLTPSCKKDPGISPIPAITFDSLAPNPCIAYRDSIRIIISYTDGDGDLGQNATATKNLFVTDSRDSLVTQFTIPQLASGSYTGPIQGNLNILLPPQYFVNSADNTETVTYYIYVTDRAGNKSNTVTTTPLVINR